MKKTLLAITLALGSLTAKTPLPVDSPFSPIYQKNKRNQEMLSYLSTPLSEMEYTNDSLLNRYIRKAKESYDEIPELAKFKLDPHSCSGYARRAAEKNFGKIYHWRDSWDLKYVDEVVERLDNKPYKTLDSLRDVGVLKPGMIIGAKYPGWKYSFENRGITKDAKGKFPEFPHTMLYVGKNKQGELTFHHQWGNRIEEATENDLKKYNVKPVLILNSYLEKDLASNESKDKIKTQG